MEWKKSCGTALVPFLDIGMLSVQMRKTVTHLLLQQALDERRLQLPELAEVSTGLQRVDPDRETEAQGERGTDNNQPALGT
jgi:hypothetical protein